MTPAEIQEARRELGLTLESLARLLGYRASRHFGADLASGRRRLRDPQRRLLEAYLAGYRPRDWPHDHR